MSQRSQLNLQELSTAPNFQLRLSEIFLNPSSCIRFQQDSIILVHKQNRYVEIYACDQYYSCFENYFRIQEIYSLSNIKVKYERQKCYLIIIYQRKNSIVFERRTTLDSRPEYNRVSQDSSRQNKLQSIIFNEEAPIISISDIIECSETSLYCFITVNTGNTYLLSVINSKLSIVNIKPQNRTIGFLKGIASTFVDLNKKTYKNCKSNINLQRNSQPNTTLYLTLMLNQQIHVKYFSNLSSTSSLTQQWTLSKYNSPLNPSTYIINTAYLPQTNSQTSVLILCSIDTRICLYIITLSLESIQKTKQIKLLDNIFDFQEPMYKQMQDQSRGEGDGPSGNTPYFDQEHDRVDLQEFHGKLYMLYRKKIFSNNTHLYKYYLVEVFKVKQQWSYLQAIQLNIDGCATMVRICDSQKYYTRENQMENQSKQRLLLIGQSICYSIVENDNLYQESSDGFTQLLKGSSQSRSRRPPIPKYEQKIVNQIAMEEQKVQKNLEQKQKKIKEVYENQFTEQKIKRYINRKQWVHLFKLLEKQKKQYQIKNNQSGIEDKGQQISYLHTLVLIELFTQKGSKNQLQVESVKSLFSSIQAKYKQRKEDFAQFLQFLFVKKQWPQIKQLLIQFYRQKKYHQLYDVCLRTIPHFIIEIQKGIKGEIELDLAGFSQCYLNLYETLLQLQAQGQNRQEQKLVLQEYSFLVSKINVKLTAKICSQNLLHFAEKYIQISVEFQQIFVQVAIKYRNFYLVNYLISRRVFARNDVRSFFGAQFHGNDRETALRTLVNFVNFQIQFAKNDPSTKKNLGLYMLECIPKQFCDQIYEHLRNIYPKIAIMFGCMQNKSRKQIAAYIEDNPSMFDTQFQTSEQLLTVLYPFYRIGGKQIKINVDLAQLIQEKTFTSYNKIIQGNKIFIVPKNKWNEFVLKSKKYLSESQMINISRKFNSAQ